jgi:hypothetical protein
LRTVSAGGLAAKPDGSFDLSSAKKRTVKSKAKRKPAGTDQYLRAVPSSPPAGAQK